MLRTMARTWWQLSFSDPRRPQGQQWLGGLNTEAATIRDAITWAHLAGINPGGEVQFVGIITDDDDPISPDWVDQLFTDPQKWMAQPLPRSARPVRVDWAPMVNGHDVRG